MRQVLFLAYCGRHAQSGRRLLEDKATNGQYTSLTRLTRTIFRLAYNKIPLQQSAERGDMLYYSAESDFACWALK